MIRDNINEASLMLTPHQAHAYVPYRVYDGRLLSIRLPDCLPATGPFWLTLAPGCQG
jgi:hypothetical protein